MDIKQEIENFRERWYSHDEELLQKKRKYRNLKELEEKLESSQFAIDLEGYHFECLFREKPGEYLYVSYNGAQYTDLPEFPRWGYHNLYNGSMLCLEDPMYYKDIGIICGSFYGDREKSCIIISLGIIKAICRKLGLGEDKVIFFSSSQGGYCGMYASTLMPNTLSIGINPRLYIQDTPQVANFVTRTGIDLAAPDSLHRNNIIRCVTQGKSKHVMLFNVQCEHDWIHHGLRFCNEFGIEPHYGIAMKDNCMFWVYDCTGAPHPHVSFETKSIFMFIDRVAKAFYAGRVTEEMRKAVLIINECWHDIYELKKYKIKQEEYNKQETDRISPDFLFIRGGRMSAGKIIVSLHNIAITPKNKNGYNFYRHNILNKNRKLTVRISGVEGSVEKFTVGIYDFKNERRLHYQDYKITDTVELTFATGENIEGVAVCVYAGLAGKTQGQKLMMGNFEVYEEVL